MSDGRRKVFMKAVLQWIWIIGVVGFSFVMARHYWDRLDLSEVRLSPGAIAASFALIALGKILIAFASVRVFTLRVGEDRTFAFLAYHLSQPGKYIPGSVWQHVSRAYLYRSRGVRPGAIAEALAMEAAWLLATAMALGLILLLLTRPVVVRDGMTLITPAQPLLIAATAAVAVTLGAAFIHFMSRRLRSFMAFVRSVSVLDVPLIALLAAMWVILGLSLCALLPSSSMEPACIPYIIGLFAIAYALGFVVIFAPAGLGVREAVLVAGMVYCVDLAPALVVIAMHRLLYLFNDLVFFFIASLWKSSAGTQPDAAH